MARLTGFAGGAFINVEGAEQASFDGPTIEDMTLVQNVAMFPRDFSSRFSGPGLSFAVVGILPVGLSLSSVGVLSGTPTMLGTTNSLEIRATDSGAIAVDSNSFAITIAASLPGVQRAGFMANPGRMMSR